MHAKMMMTRIGTGSSSPASPARAYVVPRLTAPAACLCSPRPAAASVGP
eukprot:CAMPEP_0170161346 /NCGR_PEP_ID=MMETSP0033_2-20121228/75880_1 /TAXON_ID=195969 /ORGANISM="Dolichomastix tenuilepis, Strain CCMP3274" /LENGTH=48 /DNA_ID= /DNA_START= /DNA_END= /DNA_ORIENTATION=